MLLTLYKYYWPNVSEYVTLQTNIYKSIYFYVFNQFILSDRHRALLPATLLINCEA